MKQFSRAALAALALFSAIALGASGCGFRGHNGASNDPRIIEFLAPSYGPATKPAWDAVIAGFTRQYPQYKVNLQLESWDTIDTVLSTKLVSQATTPDLLNIDGYAKLARDGRLYAARDILPSGVVADFDAGFAANASLDGRQYGMPLFASTRKLFYNKDLFGRAGLAQPPAAWQQLTDAARRISALGGGVAGYGLPLGAEEAQGETSIWIFGAGGSWGNSSTLTIESPANLEGVTAMRALADSGATQPTPGATRRTDVINAFVQGKLGMIAGLPPVIDKIAKENPGLRFGTAPSPTKDGKPVTLGVADHLMAFKKSAGKQDALRAFLGYFYSAQVYPTFVRALSFIPATKSGVRVLKDDPVTKAFAATLADAKFYPATNPKWPAAQRSLKANAGLLTQGKSPQDMLRIVARDAAQ